MGRADGGGLRWVHDEQAIVAGDPIQTTLDATIAASVAVLLYATPESLGRAWCRAEVHTADLQGVPVIAVLPPGSSLPSWLSPRHVLRIGLFGSRGAVVGEIVRAARIAGALQPAVGRRRAWGRAIEAAPGWGAAVGIACGLLARATPTLVQRVVAVQVPIEDGATATLRPDALAQTVVCALNAGPFTLGVAAWLPKERPGMEDFWPLIVPGSARVVVPDTAAGRPVTLETGAQPLLSAADILGAPRVIVPAEPMSFGLRLAGVHPPPWADAGLLPLNSAQIVEQIPLIDGDSVCEVPEALVHRLVVIGEVGDAGRVPVADGLGAREVSSVQAQALVVAAATAGTLAWRLDLPGSMAAVVAVLILGAAWRPECVSLFAACAAVAAVAGLPAHLVLPFAPLVLLAGAGMLLWRLRW